MKKTQTESGSALPKKLRRFYGIGEFGQQLSIMTLNMYLLYFYTNVLGISGAAAGTLLLVARVWDAINDPIMGMIIDNTHSKHGKCRPYLLYCALPAGVFLALTFCAPNLSNTAKLVWAYVTYIGQGMLYTATGISYTSLISRITADPLERVGLNQSRAFISMFAAIFISSMTLPLIQAITKVSNERVGFAVVISVYGVLQALCYWFVFRLTKGHDQPEPKAERTENGSVFKDLFHSLGYVIKNPLWRWLVGSTLVYCTSAAITQGVIVYYVKYYLERPDLVGIASLCSMISSFFAIVLLKVFAKKLGKAKSCALGVGVAIVCVTIRLLTRDHIIPLYLFCLLLSGFGLGLFSSLLVPSLMDSIDYGEWMLGKRNDALVLSANSFGNKLGHGLGASALGFMLDSIGYNAEAATQSAAVRGGIFNIAIFVPLVAFCIVFLIMLVYSRYEKKMPQIRQELRERQAAQQAVSEN